MKNYVIILGKNGSLLATHSDLYRNLSYRNPLKRSTISEVETAARRESTVSWLADSTQLSMGRSMHDDDISL